MPSGAQRTYTNREIEGIPCSYNPLQTGKQTVTLTVGNQTAYFTVTVAAKKADTYRLKENAVFTQKEKSIVFDRTATAEELKESPGLRNLPHGKNQEGGRLCRAFRASQDSAFRLYPANRKRLRFYRILV